MIFWHEVKASLGSMANVEFEEIDCLQSENVCTQQKVKVFPTFAVYEDQVKVDLFYGDRTFSAFNNFVRGHLGLATLRSHSKLVDVSKLTCKRIGGDDFVKETQSGLTLVL